MEHALCALPIFIMTTLSNTDSPRPHLFGLLAGIFLSAGLCLAAVTVTRAWMRISETSVIQVTGSARKDVRSDLAIWYARIECNGTNFEETQKKSKEQLAEVVAFLKAAGQTDFVIKPVESHAGTRN
jgi:hypothetical protein